MVTLTERAKEYLKKVSDGGFVTLGVKGGGCSGMTYVWGLSKEKTNAKIKWSEPIGDVLLLDPVAEMYLFGSQVDYIEEVAGSYLAVKNPQSKSSCGCGESFAI